MERFNTQATFWLRPNRLYRVYVTKQGLYFIRIGGQRIDWVAAFNQLGLLGVWLGRKLNARRDRALAARVAEADHAAPEQQLASHPHNFHVTVNQIVSTSFDAGKQTSLQGPHAAVWRLELLRGEQWRLQFDTVEDAQIALPVLTDALGGHLKITVVWNEKKQRFVSARGDMPIAQRA